MKKLSVIALALVMAFSTLLSGCSSSNSKSSSNDDSLQYVMDKGELIVGFDDSFPPMGYRGKDNKIVGILYEVDLLDEILNDGTISIKKNVKDILIPSQFKRIKSK